MSNVRYPFEGSDSDFLKAQLLYVTCATSDKDWHSMEHSHYFSELLFVSKFSVRNIGIDKYKVIFLHRNLFSFDLKVSCSFCHLCHL